MSDHNLRTFGKEVLEAQCRINDLLNMQFGGIEYRPLPRLRWWDRMYLRLDDWMRKRDARFATRRR